MPSRLRVFVILVCCISHPTYTTSASASPSSAKPTHTANINAMDKRVRTGCITCRKRRIKCDEKKPSCARCEAANFVCEGYSAPRRVNSRSPTASSSTRSPNRTPPRDETPFSGLSWRHTSWRQEQLPLYHHFVTTTSLRFFRADHITFWRDQVAQLSVGFDLVYEALLAVGALHRASLLNCQNKDGQEAARSRVLGLHAYGNALRMLPTHLSQNAIKETIAVQAVLILLTFCEVCPSTITFLSPERLVIDAHA